MQMTVNNVASFAINIPEQGYSGVSADAVGGNVRYKLPYPFSHVGTMAAAVSGVGDSFTFGGGNVTLTDAAANFTSALVGKSITIKGATTAGNNGTFTIASVGSSTQITWANGAGATEAFTGTYNIPTASVTLPVHVEDFRYKSVPWLPLEPSREWQMLVQQGIVTITFAGGGNDTEDTAVHNA